jgi:hypothetical protein
VGPAARAASPPGSPAPENDTSGGKCLRQVNDGPSRVRLVSPAGPALACTSEEYLNIAAGDAILAGIAASDAICGLTLGRLHRGDDHHGAEDLLREAAQDGPQLATILRRLLTIKDAAHYGTPAVSARKAADAAKWAAQLVERAVQEAER